MNLRQRYKRAKQKIALLEKQPVAQNIVEVQDKPIRRCICRKSVKPWEMDHPEIIMEELAHEIMKDVFKCAKVESAFDVTTGDFVISVRLRVIDERLVNT